jgi:drug/metabolite transporter (DMT)-like permease
MRALFYASLAVVPWVAVTLLLRWLIKIEQWPVGLVGTFSRVVTLPLLGAWILGTGTGWRRLRPRGRLGWLVLMGAISIVINLTWFAAVHWTTATNMAVLIRFDVLFVVLIGAGLGLERIGPAQIVLVPVMLFGLALLAEIHRFDWGGHAVGDLMTIVTALGLAANAFIIRHIMQVMDEASVALYNHAISMLGFVALALASGDFARADEVFDTPAAWLPIAALGVLVAVSLPLYYVALGRMDVWKLRLFMLSGPVLCGMVEWPLWGGQFSGMQWLGAAVIVAGLAVLIRIESRAEPQPPGAPLAAESFPQEPSAAAAASPLQPQPCRKDPNA